jgi:hypothetical protein
MLSLPGEQGGRLIERFKAEDGSWHALVTHVVVVHAKQPICNHPAYQGKLFVSWLWVHWSLVHQRRLPLDDEPVRRRAH